LDILCEVPKADAKVKSFYTYLRAIRGLTITLDGAISSFGDFVDGRQ
jgi:hypothetical protein